MAEIYMWELSWPEEDGLKLNYSDSMAKSVEEEVGGERVQIVFFEPGDFEFSIEEVEE